MGERRHVVFDGDEPGDIFAIEECREPNRVALVIHRANESRRMWVDKDTLHAIAIATYSIQFAKENE